MQQTTPFTDLIRAKYAEHGLAAKRPTPDSTPQERADFTKARRAYARDIRKAIHDAAVARKGT
jgi:hypothetical protein